MNLQHLLFAADKLSRNRGGVIGRICIGDHLYAQLVFARGDLHRVKFVSLDMVEYNEVLFVSAFQHMGVTQISIDPNRQMRLGEFMLDLDFQSCRGRGRE